MATHYAHNLAKTFAPRVLSRAVRAFDQATMMVVLACWGVVLFFTVFTLYTVNLSTQAKQEALTAAAIVPRTATCCTTAWP